MVCHRAAAQVLGAEVLLPGGFRVPAAVDDHLARDLGQHEVVIEGPRFGDSYTLNLDQPDR